MAVSLTGPGSLFVRLGHIFKLVDLVLTHNGTTLAGSVDTLYSDYAASSRDHIAGLYPALTSHTNASGPFLAYLQGLAMTTLMEMVADDTGPITSSVASSLATLVGQMRTAVASVDKCNVGATVAAVAGNTGDAAFVVGTKDREGLDLEYLFAEAIAARVTTDAQSGGATSGREAILLTGKVAAPAPFSSSWPLGSGATTTLTLVNAPEVAAGGYQTWLANGDFETFTVANVPDGWHIGVGEAGTSVLKSTAQHFTGISSLQFAGDSAEQTAVYQELGVDTPYRPTPLDQVACNFWVKASGTPAAGVLTVELVDGSGTPIVDSQSVANSMTVALTTLGTTFVPKSVFFRTPRVLPASVRLQFRLSTALSTGTSVFIDRVALARPVQVYAGGPYVAGFSGATPVISGDGWTLTTTNDRAGAIQTYFDRFFSMRTVGQVLPSSGSPTIPDSLIA